MLVGKRWCNVPAAATDVGGWVLPGFSVVALVQFVAVGHEEGVDQTVRGLGWWS